MSKLPLILTLLVGLIFAVSMGALLAMRNAGSGGSPGNAMAQASVRSPDPGKPDPNITDLRFPPFALVAQDGRAIDQSAFMGRVSVVDFMFSHCPFICPTLTRIMGEMAADLTGTSVQFMSFSVDPKNDTPAVLRAYAEKNGIDTARWRLIATTSEFLKDVRRDLKLEIAADTRTPITLPDGSMMSNILHPSWFALIGPKGELLGIYLATVPENIQELTARARVLAESLEKRP